MKITLTANEFADRFQRVRPDQFSRQALRALFEHFEQIEQDTGEEMEFNPIAICCNYAEYASATDAKRSREGSNETEEPTKEQEAYALNWLRVQTDVLKTSIGVVVREF